MNNAQWLYDQVPGTDDEDAGVHLTSAHALQIAGELSELESKREMLFKEKQHWMAVAGDNAIKIEELRRWACGAFEERDALRSKIEEATTRRQNAEVARRQSEARLQDCTDACNMWRREAQDHKERCDALHMRLLALTHHEATRSGTAPDAEAHRNAEAAQSRQERSAPFGNCPECGGLGNVTVVEKT